MMSISNASCWSKAKSPRYIRFRSSGQGDLAATLAGAIIVFVSRSSRFEAGVGSLDGCAKPMPINPDRQRSQVANKNREREQRTWRVFEKKFVFISVTC